MLEAGLDRFCKMRATSSVAPHSKGKGRGVKKRWSASRWSTAASLATIQVLDDGGVRSATSPAFASAVLEEEYCARLCSAGQAAVELP